MSNESPAAQTCGTCGNGPCVGGNTTGEGDCPKWTPAKSAATVGFRGRSVPIASVEQALYYVKSGISSLGSDPFDSDEEWQGFIEEHGVAGAYLMSAQSALEEALQRAR